MKRSKQWSIWKKLAFYPGFVCLAVIVICIWVVIDDTLSPPRIIDGRADDSPRMAAGLLAAFAAILYGAYLVSLTVIRSIANDKRPRDSGQPKHEQGADEH